MHRGGSYRANCANVGGCPAPIPRRGTILLAVGETHGQVPCPKMLVDPEGVEPFPYQFGAKPHSTPSGLVNRRGVVPVGFTHGQVPCPKNACRPRRGRTFSLPVRRQTTFNPFGVGKSPGGCSRGFHPRL